MIIKFWGPWHDLFLTLSIGCGDSSIVSKNTLIGESAVNEIKNVLL